VIALGILGGTLVQCLSLSATAPEASNRRRSKSIGTVRVPLYPLELASPLRVFDCTTDISLSPK
jgi:hypothetical protein